MLAVSGSAVCGPAGKTGPAVTIRRRFHRRRAAGRRAVVEGEMRGSTTVVTDRGYDSFAS